MARRSVRISSRASATPQPIKRASLAHDIDNAPQTAPKILTTVIENDDMPGAFPDSPSFLAPAAKRQCTTPERKTGIVPAREEMHPQVAHQSTVKANTEARWLGFQSIDAKVATISTPTKHTSTNRVASPGFKFTFQREQSLELSPAAKSLMQEKRAEAARIKEQMKSTHSGESVEEGIARRIATPKSKRSRFSDAHNAQFDKMDSIAGHASAFRKETVRSAIKPTPQSPACTVRRSPSKNNLLTTPSKTPATLKRKADDQITRAVVDKQDREDDLTSSRKRVKTEQGSIPSQIPLASVAVTPTKSLLSRTSSIKSVKTKIPAPAVQTPVKATAKPTTSPSASRSQLPNLFSRSPIRPSSTVSKPLLSVTPSRASQDNNPFKSVTPVPPQTTGLLSRFQQLRGTPVKSILRTPQRLYSDDPAKIAAGTHLATPPQIQGRRVPATAPVNKRVDFSLSTKAREASKEASLSPFTVVPPEPAESTGTIAYPSLDEFVQTTPVSAQKRRQSSGPQDFTFRVGSEIVFAAATTPTKISTPRASSAYTIRHVPAEPELPAPSTVNGVKQRKIRFENAQSVAQTAMSPTVTLGSKKRKFDFENGMAEQDADKENVDAEDEQRPVKRFKQSASPAVTAPVRPPIKQEVKKRPTTLGVKPKAALGKPVDRVIKKTGTSISMARLNALAQPKKRG